VPLVQSVTVVIPARNAEAYLEEAIHSVLAQSEPVSEVIVVDDGSEDGTGQIARGFGSAVRYLRQDAAGAGAARNRGIDAARSELIGFLDADDIWTADSVRCRRAALAADVGCEAVFGEVEQFVCDRLSPGEQARIHIPVPRLPGWLAGSMLARRAVFKRIGMFETEHRAGEFVAWHLRARRDGLRTVMLADLVLRRRVHATNLGRTDPEGRNDLLGIVRADLAARRGG
jgi:cellulose synthase/poly-beta-1,6-N-acetylglucosamine synthase-like glycosyltransferase